MKDLSKELINSLENLKQIEEKENSDFRTSEIFERGIYKLVDAMENGVPEQYANVEKFNDENYGKALYANRFLENAKALLEELAMDGYSVGNSISLIDEAQEELSDLSSELDDDED